MADKKLAADAMLGKLAVWLRILGYDTFYRRDVPDDELVSLARREGRLVLTRDAGLAGRLNAGERFLITRDSPWEQLREAVAGLGLGIDRERLFTLCTRCNTKLVDAERESVRGLVPDYVLMKSPAFKRCLSCGRVYWQGTHYRRMAAKVAGLPKEIDA